MEFVEQEILNTVLTHIWPLVSATHIKPRIRDEIEFILREAIFKHIPHFDKISLGTKLPELNNMNILHASIHEVVIHAELVYDGNADIVTSLVGKNFIEAGVKDIKVFGTLEATLVPAMSLSSPVTNLSVCFPNQPTVDFDFTHLANILDFPGIKQLVHRSVNKKITKRLVKPNSLQLIP